MGKLALGGIILLAVGLIIAFALLPQIADNQQKLTTKLTHTNETVNVTATGCYTATKGQVETNDSRCNISLVESATAGEWEYDNCHISSMVLTNASGDTLVLNTSYTLWSDRGVVQLLNVSPSNKTSLDTAYMTYQYCDDGYISSSGGRSVAGLIVLMAGLCVIGFAIYYFMRDKQWWKWERKRNQEVYTELVECRMP